MILAHMPSVATLESEDDAQLTAELRFARLRAQAGVVRTLTDHVDHSTLPGSAEDHCRQLLEKTARLACRLWEAVESMTRVPAPTDSGVFARPHLDPEGSSFDPIRDEPPRGDRSEDVAGQ
jgi:hypothetical protein